MYRPGNVVAVLACNDSGSVGLKLRTSSFVDFARSLWGARAHLAVMNSRRAHP